MNEITESDITLAMRAHACTREEAIENGFAAGVAEARRQQFEQHQLTKYQFQRAAEYPPMTEYLDAVVKGDQEQMQAYIEKCLAVKAKYPKPTQE